MPEIPRPTTEEMLARHDAERNRYFASCITEMIARAAPIDLAYDYDGRIVSAAGEPPIGKLISLDGRIPAQRQNADAPTRQAAGY